MATGKSMCEPEDDEVKCFVFQNDDIVRKGSIQQNILRKNSEFCDFKITTSDGVTFHVHKVVLASVCPYFKASFSIDMKEAIDNAMVITDLSNQELEAVLNYLYTGKIEISILNAQQIFQNATYFNLPELGEHCTAVLVKHFGVNDNILDLWRFGENFYNPKLAEECVDFILENANEMFKLVCFLDLTHKEIKKLIASERIICTEKQLYSFAMKWITHDFETRKQYINSFISEIRFLLLSEAYILSDVLTNPILLNSKEFLLMTVDMFKFKLETNITNENTTNVLQFPKCAKPRIGAASKEILYIMSSNVYTFDSANSKFVSQSTFPNQGGIATSTFSENFVLISGGNNTRNCVYYCPITNTMKKFPSMKESRQFHSMITLKDKIYCCGGDGKKSTEIFDIGLGIWNNGPVLQECENYFGIITAENSVYIVGKAVEKLDPREGEWRKVSNQALTGDKFRAVFHEYNIYGFSSTDAKIFDVRKNQWMDEPKIRQPTNWNSRFDISELFGEIYFMGFDNNTYIKHHILDIKQNKWNVGSVAGLPTTNVSVETVVVYK